MPWISVALSAAALTASVQGAPDHPSFPFPSSFDETVKHWVDDELVYSGSGEINVACQYACLYLTAAVDMKLDWGHTKKHVTWIGWNSMVTRKVDRYLIIGDEERTCTTYPDHDPSGYVDPIMLMENRYQLQGSSASGDPLYNYTWHFGKQTQVASMVTTPDGKAPKSVEVVTTGDGHTRRWLFEYSNQRSVKDKSVFFEYKKQDCQPVSNFTSAPEICVDSWLSLQYECGGHANLVQEEEASGPTQDRASKADALRSESSTFV
eukprot:TRINITY_DN8985_c0_g1_i1.p1 TRINITY_DN8985_c0_g1~~TRINITY_DN8985_c0_g1_i1.p1  ORF type:complete len:264 (+),score=43.87 TRINITY_DN8985_c0_g1_i1:371-1162(+)